MATGEDILNLAMRHLGEEYVLGALAPKNDPSYDGPWDCAEFVSWCIYQSAKILYGCSNNHGDPAIADAYTGYWDRDADDMGRKISIDEAAGIPGAAVLRVGPKIGHIVISDGRGGTVEAHSTATGVIQNTLDGRRWTSGIIVPGIDYKTKAGTIQVQTPARIYRLVSPFMHDDKIKEIQNKLEELGFNPKGVDGIYGPGTYAAVLAFQQSRSLMPDGEVGSLTEKALGINLT